MAVDVYDCAIIGGGVAGLSLSILLARAGKKVILFEKESYPFHKVCGEFISNESVPFLESIGVDLSRGDLPQINQLLLSSPSGITIRRPLDIGGTGLSRYELDYRLYQIAVAEKVDVRVKTKVQQVNFSDGRFYVKTGAEEVVARVVAGAYGKNSNIDVQLGRKYKSARDSRVFIAVKYHILTDFDRSFVEMHNFPGGYCGLSAIEDGKVNMSYISRAANLKKHGSIANMERNVLSVNPYLKKYFAKSEFLFQKPLTISHLYFQIREPVADHLLLLGDSAGNIAPLSGNGMSMALQSSKLACKALLAYLNGEISMQEMEQKYTGDYYNAFSGRIRVARSINHLFGNPALTDTAFRFFRVFPGLVDFMSKQIHGEIF